VTGTEARTSAGAQAFFGLFRRREQLDNAEFRNQHDMRRFVLAAAEVEDLDEVLLCFDSEFGRHLLDQLLGQFPISLGCGQRGEFCSFQRVIIPLLTLLTKVASVTPHKVAFKRVLTCIYTNEAFWAQLVDLLAQVGSENSIVDDQFVPDERDGDLWQPQNAVEVFLPVVRLWECMLRMVTDCLANEVFGFWIERTRAVWAMVCADNQREFQVTPLCIEADWVTRALRRLDRSVNKVPPHSSPASSSQRSGLAGRPSTLLSATRSRVLQTTTLVPPGFLRPEGPRHSNDHADFRQISVVPGGEELLSQHEPFLPPSPGATHLEDNPADRYLDRHFRLFRADMVQPLRDAALAFTQQVRPEWQRTGKVRDLFRDPKTGVRLSFLHNVELVSVLPSFRGLSLELAFDHPEKAGNSQKNLKEYWERGRGSRRLNLHSLVGLALSSEEVGEQSISIASVTNRDLLKKDRPCVHVQPIDPSLLLSTVSRLSQSRCNLLFQVAGHCVVAYAPVLEALKNHGEGSIPFDDYLYRHDRHTLLVRPPPCSTQSRLFDLAPLIRKGTPRINVPVSSYENLLRMLSSRQPDLVLDESQLRAVAFALSSDVSLIQGPPGTGKSYVGNLLIQVLLRNRPQPSERQRFEGLNVDQFHENSPILCICYTNHALDQFLDHLRQDGVPLEVMVRIGSRSRVPDFESRNLRSLTYDVRLSPGEYKSMKQQQRALSEEQVRLETSFAVLQDPEKSWASLQGYLQNDFAEFYDGLVGKDPDGFVTAGATTPKKAWKTWSHPVRSLKADRIPAAAVLRSENVANAEELLYTSDPWTLTPPQRVAVRAFLMEDFRRLHQRQFERCLRQFESLRESLEHFRRKKQLCVLREAQVVGATTTGCAMHQDLIRALRPQIVIVEEAGEVFEAHLLSCIGEGTQQLVLIGDHMQLRPKCADHSLTVASGCGHNLDVSLFERLASSGATPLPTDVPSAAAVTSTTAAAMPFRKPHIVTLSMQRRMRPEIADLIRETGFYPTLSDHSSVRAYPDVKGTANNVWFVDHEHAEKEGTVGSYENMWEARMVVAMVRHLLHQEYKADEIAVITPYVGQLLRIRELLGKEHIVAFVDERTEAELEGGSALEALIVEDDDDPDAAKPPAAGAIEKRALRDCVRISTVDNFQGEEALVVILSTVRSNQHGRIGFLKDDNRVNVMLSRAKHGLFILGSAMTVLRKESGGQQNLFQRALSHLRKVECVGRELVLRCERHGQETRVSEPEHFRLRSPDGGCQARCGARLPCGHACERSCHIDDAKHQLFRCLRECMKPRECQHPCSRVCSEDCGVCEEKVKARLPCGHTQPVRCHQLSELSHFHCPATVQMTLPFCGHTQAISCGQAAQFRVFLDSCGSSSNSQPRFRVDDILANVPRQMLKLCKSACGKLRSCQHECCSRCGNCTVSTLSALKTASPQAQFSGSDGLVNQYWQHATVSCSHLCDRDLFCGHRCKGVCHKTTECPPCTQPCRHQCEHSACDRPCSEPCPPCVETCSWRCSHHECQLPCGVPCVRPPCDERCSKLLSCGHRCPAACGERCPSPAYCRICLSALEANDGHGGDLVDMICLTQLRDWDTSESPLVVLGCGHALTVESADNVFRGDKKIAELRCPSCKQPLSGVYRYRPQIQQIGIEFGKLRMNRYAAQQRERLQAQLREAEASLKSALGQCAALSDRSPQRAIKAARRTFNSSRSQIERSLRDAEQTHANVERFVHPEKLVHDAYVACLQQRGQPTPPRNFGPNTSEIHLRELKVRLRVCREHLRLVERRLVAFEKQKLHKSQALQAVPSGLDGSQAGELSFQKQWVMGWLARDGAAFHRLRSDANTIQLLRSAREHTLSMVRLYFRTALLLRELYNDDVACKFSTALVREKAKPPLDSLIADCEKASDTETGHLSKQLAEQIHQWLEAPPSAEEKREIFLALSAEVGTNNNISYGGHWYVCPNGHPYAIGECGGAMQEGRCIECGSPIGGGSHQLVAGNRRASDFLLQVGDQ